MQAFDARISLTPLSTENIPHQANQLIACIRELFTPAVTQFLPPSFQQLSSDECIYNWLLSMANESKLMLVQNEFKQPIGLIFAHESAPHMLQLGYLLGQQFWGKGYAFEMLTSYISYLSRETQVTSVLAGVSKENTASIALLNKLGFCKQMTGLNNHSDEYCYKLVLTH